LFLTFFQSLLLFNFGSLQAPLLLPLPLLFHLLHKRLVLFLAHHATSLVLFLLLNSRLNPLQLMLEVLLEKSCLSKHNCTELVCFGLDLLRLVSLAVHSLCLISYLPSIIYSSRLSSRLTTAFSASYRPFLNFWLMAPKYLFVRSCHYLSVFLYGSYSAGLEGGGGSYRSVSLMESEEMLFLRLRADILILLYLPASCLVHP
jgi:hypothetical protein